MIYSIALTVPASTAERAPVSTYVDVNPGVVNPVFLTFPRCCAGLVGARVKVRERVLWPTNPGAWFATDGFTYKFPESFALEGDPERFTLEGYSLDEVFDHTLTLVLVVNPPEPLGLEAYLALSTVQPVAEELTYG